MPNQKKLKLFSMKTVSVLGTLFFLLVGALYIYALHTGVAREWLDSLRHLGVIGLLVGILLLTFLTIIPVPDEFVSLFLVEIYGPWLGLLCSLIGGVFGAMVAAYLCRWMARPFLGDSQVKFLKVVDAWIEKRGVLGLLILRWIPIVPFHLLNYVCGLLKIKRWTFLWTTFLGIIPYNLALTGLFSGIRFGSLRWGILGSTLLVLLLMTSWLTRRFWNRSLISG